MVAAHLCPTATLGVEHAAGPRWVTGVVRGNVINRAQRPGPRGFKLNDIDVYLEISDVMATLPQETAVQDTPMRLGG